MKKKEIYFDKFKFESTLHKLERIINELNDSIITNIEEVNDIINDKTTFLNNRWDKLYKESCNQFGFETLDNNEFINVLTRNKYIKYKDISNKIWSNKFILKDYLLKENNKFIINKDKLRKDNIFYTESEKQNKILEIVSKI